MNQFVLQSYFFDGFSTRALANSTPICAVVSSTPVLCDLIADSITLCRYPIGLQKTSSTGPDDSSCFKEGCPSGEKHPCSSSGTSHDWRISLFESERALKKKVSKPDLCSRFQTPTVVFGSYVCIASVSYTHLTLPTIYSV